MKKKRIMVYIVESVHRGFLGRISSDGYDSLEKAQQFIENRHGKPQKISEYKYQDNNGNTYYIHDILII